MFTDNQHTRPRTEDHTRVEVYPSRTPNVITMSMCSSDDVTCYLVTDCVFQIQGAKTPVINVHPEWKSVQLLSSIAVKDREQKENHVLLLLSILKPGLYN